MQKNQTIKFCMEMKPNKIPSPVECNHLVIVVRIDEYVVDVSLATTSGDDCSTAVAIHGEIP